MGTLASRPNSIPWRLLLAAAVLALASPAVASGLGQLGGEERAGPIRAENVTFVSAQGGFAPGEDGRVVAVDTDTREVVWEFSRGGPGEDTSYYDVDPLGPDELLVVEHVTGERATVLRVDWREGGVEELFDVPPDTHDVDALGDGRYVVADKFDHRAYVYDRANESVVWEYEFAEHFPEYPAAGEAPSTRPSGGTGYTHLNDVDAVAGGEAFLLSPRNFDRVVLVDRSTGEAEFVLGGQDDHGILQAQHNPVLLSRDPPTVLVADSENDRVVEYRRRANGSWALVWQYRGNLLWPRDADRLPNGNTLIVDTLGQRVLEVTPEREVVWQRRVAKMPYDVERLGYGDEPRGPPTPDDAAATASTHTVSPATELYARALWILPAWIGIGEFYSLLGAAVVLCVWLGAEVLAGLRGTRRA